MVEMGNGLEVPSPPGVSRSDGHRRAVGGVESVNDDLIEVLRLVGIETTAVEKGKSESPPGHIQAPISSQERATLRKTERQRERALLPSFAPLNANVKEKRPRHLLPTPASSKLTRRRQEARKREKTLQLSIMRNAAAVGIQPTQQQQQQQQHHIMPPGQTLGGIPIHPGLQYGNHIGGAQRGVGVGGVGGGGGVSGLGPGGDPIRDVWASNLDQEMAQVRNLITQYPYVSMV